MPEMSEVVIVTIPDTVSEDLPSVVEEDKTVLVTAELTPQSGYRIYSMQTHSSLVSNDTLSVMFVCYLMWFSREDVLTVTPVEAEAEVSRANSLSKEEAVIGNVTYKT